MVKRKQKKPRFPPRPPWRTRSGPSRAIPPGGVPPRAPRSPPSAHGGGPPSRTGSAPRSSPLGPPGPPWRTWTGSPPGAGARRAPASRTGTPAQPDRPGGPPARGLSRGRPLPAYGPSPQCADIAAVLRCPRGPPLDGHEARVGDPNRRGAPPSPSPNPIEIPIPGTAGGTPGSSGRSTSTSRRSTSATSPSPGRGPLAKPPRVAYLEPHVSLSGGLELPPTPLLGG